MGLRELLVRLLSVTVCASLAFAADPVYYQQKATWQDTLQGSRQALIEWEADHPEIHASEVNWGLWYRLGPMDCGARGFEFLPEFLTGQIDQSTLYDGATGWQQVRQNQDGVVANIAAPDNAATFLFRTVTAGADRHHTVYLGSDDGMAVYLNGDCLLSNDCARGAAPNQDKVDLALKAGENQLLLKIYNRGGGHGYYFSASEQPGASNPSPGVQRRDALWTLIKRDFQSPEQVREIRQEHADGIWDQEWESGDILDLAHRYVVNIRVKTLRDAAERLTLGDSAETRLVDVRKLYYQSVTFTETLAELDGLDIEAVSRAICDLSKSFPDQYHQGPELLTQLTRLQSRHTALRDSGDVEALVKIGRDILDLRQRALRSNPLIDFDKMLVVKRSVSGDAGLPQNWQGNCALPKSGYDNELAILSMVRSEGELTTLYRSENGRFIGDVDLHFDAGKMLFSMPGSHDRWQIWEMSIDGSGLRQLTPGIHADVDNYDACYLPDGRVLFDSTRCFQGVPCVGGSNTVANLCLMSGDGGNIRQLCFDQDHDWCPTVLNDGRVLYSRWEYSDSPHYFTRLLFHMNPDGTNQMEYYGSNSPWPNSLFYARAIPNHPSAVVAVISGHHGVPRMGELLVFDPAKGRHQADGVVQRIPGYGKKVAPVIGDQIVDQSWPKFLHPYPLSDKYFVTAMQPNSQALWGIYLVDVFDNLLLLKEEPGYRLFEPVPIHKRPCPPVIPDRVDLTNPDAIVYLTDVYAGPGLKGVPRGTVKTLRLYEYHYTYPGQGGHIHIGIDGPWDVHRILGTVPVEKDGSANFRVPANTPIAVQPLDEKGRALQIMRSWFTAMPGEVLSCVGCHENQSETPAPKPAVASLREPSLIQPWYGPRRGFSFKHEIQPVLDKYCVGCHDGQQKDRPNFTLDRPSPFKNFTPSYCDLHPYVRRPGPESDYFLQAPLEYHASVSELVQMLEKGHHNVQLDAEAWDRLVTWIDLNVPDHGTWGEQQQISSHFEQRRYEMRKLYAKVLDEPEVYPAIQTQTTGFVMPEPPVQRPLSIATVENWPLTVTDARQAQVQTGLPDHMSVELSPGVKLDLVLIPAGSFVMGSANGFADESPQRAVSIPKSFYMGQFEVTNAQFALFDKTHQSGYISVYNKDQNRRGESADSINQPVIRVTWRESLAFCDWLSQKTGHKFTLPTEAEWEYACRAGTDTAMNYGEVTAGFETHANLADESVNRLTPGDSPRWIPSIHSVNDGAVVTETVGRYQPNAWGLHDMHGNVSEWTRSPYLSDSGDFDHTDPDGRKVVRGGSFYDRPKRARSSFRLGYASWQPVFNVGFRVVCEVPGAIVTMKEF